MFNFLKKLKQRYDYSIESIKNRYPCKIIQVVNVYNFDKKTILTYQAATKLNIRKCSASEILEDPMLIEKFHPTDGVKIGFIAASEIFLKNASTIEEARSKYKKISEKIFLGLIKKEGN